MNMDINPGFNARGVTNMLGIPLPLKMGLGVLAGGSIMGLVYYLSGGNKMIVLVAGLGLMFVWLLLLGFKALLNWSRQRKSSPLTQGIAGNAAAAPQGISEPARRARLDDLRRNFEQGVEKFRAAGKNLYSVPWYVLVGEPGSGKTEAIRHCNVGFPPGLQDQLQGAGGTLNMNWWFTNQAIILDTAGRLMFEEVAPGSTNEWNEFLKLLKTNRPNCPINGMLLVIPVDTLIKDTSDSIEKKAGKIAQQLDQIQRILGVRFPVFIIISKCDLLNGFREFFDDLNDPQLQHQIMGWSNPAPLDEKFNSSVVIDHLQTVKKRLIERRQQLLLDPVNTEDPQGRRIDQVDALYALPDSITNIGPRLRRYLELIFQAGEWSPQPLFLRGIYFTSSMTEGSALDAELAAVLGRPLDSLPEGRVWRRDRAYFLRDLFIEKVFREKGLVTRASNADKQQRSRRAVVLTFGFLAVLILFALTWLGAVQLEARIGKHRDFWKAADDNIDVHYAKIVDPKKENAYSTVEITDKDNKPVSMAKYFGGTNLELLKSKVDVPFLFRPLSLINGNIDTDRRTAYRSLYESAVLVPVYDAARKRLTDLAFTDWTQEATDSVLQLMKLEYANANKVSPPIPDPQVELDPLFHLILTDPDYQKFKGSDANDLQEAANWIYSPEGTDGSKNAWPSPLLQPGTPDSLAVIDDGVDKTLKFWLNQTNNSRRMGNILQVQKALDDFRTAEDTLLALKRSNVDKLDTYHGFLDTWQEQLTHLTTARDSALTAWNALLKDDPQHTTLKDMYTTEVEKIGSDRKKVYDAMLVLTETPTDAAKQTASGQSLAAQRVKLEAAITSLDDWKTNPEEKTTLDDITALDAAYLGTVKDGEVLRRRFEVAAQFYETADTFLIKKDAEKTVVLAGSMNDALDKLDTRVEAAKNPIGKILIQTPNPDDRLAQAGGMANFTIDVGARCNRYLLATSAMSPLLKNSSNDAWAAYIEALAKTMPPDHLVRPAVPFVNAEKTFLSKWSPDAVGSVAESMNAIDALAAAQVPKILDVDVVQGQSADIRKSLDDYLTAYRNYWENEVFSGLQPNLEHWSEFSAGLLNTRETIIRGALEDYSDRVIFALKKVGDSAGVTNVQAALQLGERPSFQKEGVELISRWRDMGDDSKVARRAILAMDPGNFLETYTSGTAKISDGFVARYWQQLPIAAISALAIDGKKEITDGLHELGKYERFPLAPPKVDVHDLTGPEVLLARAALEKVKGSAPNALNGGSKTIGMGSLTRDKDVDAKLDDLRGGNLLKDQQDYLNAVERFLVALPANNTPLTVRMSIVKDRLNEDGSIAQKYTYMVINQGDKQLREVYLTDAKPEFADIQYPDADMIFKFKEIPTGDFKAPVTFTGPWAPFRLIESSQVKSITRVGSKWTIEYGIKDANGKTWSLWLLFEFTNEIPDLSDWPKPHS